MKKVQNRSETIPALDFLPCHIFRPRRPQTPISRTAVSRSVPKAAVLQRFSRRIRAPGAKYSSPSRNGPAACPSFSGRAPAKNQAAPGGCRVAGQDAFLRLSALLFFPRHLLFSGATRNAGMGRLKQGSGIWRKSLYNISQVSGLSRNWRQSGFPLRRAKLLTAL